MKDKQRNYHLDVLRLLACIMVVMMHAPRPDGEQSGVFVVFISLFTQPCIGLFFMVSGSLLLPVKTNLQEFLSHRLSKIIAPTLVFTFFYLMLEVLLDGKSVNNTLLSILSIPFSAQGTGVLWFMYTLIGLYLIAPVISPFLEKASKKELEIVILLCMVTMMWPILSTWLFVTTDQTSILHGFSGYLGYFLLGYYLTKYPVRFRFLLLAIMIILPFLLYFICKYMEVGINYYTIFGYLSILVVAMSVSWFQAVLQYCSFEKVSEPAKRLLQNFSNCSFGIYLLHIFIMRRLVWNMAFLHEINPYLEYILIVLLTLSVSWLLSHAISHLPFGRYIVGFKKQS